MLVVVSLTTYYTVSRFVVSSVVVQGRSMLPTLHDGQHCLLDRWTLQYRQPQRGDVVVIQDPGHPDYAVKRVIALPGEHVLLSNGRVYVDGRELPEPYLSPGLPTLCPNANQQSLLVGQEHYFVLGDNRPCSEDSRYYGPLPRRNIIGLIAH